MSQSQPPPRILVTPDRDDMTTRRGPVPIHVLDMHYSWAVQKAGGMPLVVPYTDDLALLDAVLDDVHGVVLTGGDFDVDPSLFGEAPHPSLGKLKDDRTAFESAVLAGALRRRLPVLGICGGMQLMNVKADGGTLWQDLPSQNPSDVQHEQAAHKREAGHDVTVVAGSHFARIVGDDPLGVNTTHHQAVRDVGEGLVASGIAEDGIVEVIEDPTHPFFVGVQWHPEAMVDCERNQSLYRALVIAAEAFRGG